MGWLWCRTRAVVAGAAVALAQVALAALLIVLPTWLCCNLEVVFPPAGPFDWLDARLYAGRLLLFSFLGVGLLAHLATPHRRGWRWGPAFLLVPLTGLLALSFLSVPSALDPRMAQTLALHQVALLALYLMVLNGPVSPRGIAWSLAGGIVLQAGIGLAQFLSGRSVGLEFLGEYPLDATRTGSSVVMADGVRWLRAYGLTAHPNLLGGYLMVAMLVVGGYYLGARRRWGGLWWLIVAVGVAGLLATFSRSAWLGTAVGAVVLVALGRARTLLAGRSASLPLLIVGVVVLWFVLANWQLMLPRMGVTIEETEVRSVEERTLLDEAAWTLISRRPLLGVGLGNFSRAVTELVPESPLGPPVAPVHNLPLLAGAEVGVGGGLIWLWLTIVPWVAVWRARRRVEVTPWLAGLTAAMAALAVVGTVDYYLWASRGGSVIQWLLWALWAREWCDRLKPARSTGPGSFPRTGPP